MILYLTHLSAELQVCLEVLNYYEVRVKRGGWDACVRVLRVFFSKPLHKFDPPYFCL